MDNRQIARILRETAQLLELDGAMIGRYRSYEKAAELLESLPQPVEQMITTPEKLLELPGIGKGMVEHLTEIVKTGDYDLRVKLLKKYPSTILEVLTIQSLGPKKVALLWSTFQAATVADVERLAKEGKLRDLPGFGERSEQNILRAVETQKKTATGRFLLSTAELAANGIIEHIKKFGKSVESVTPAGSLRRGRETVGDLDLLLMMADGHTKQKDVDAVAEHILKYSDIMQVLAHGENKVSFVLQNGLQVDVRLLKKDSFGAALMYFTGSREHNVTLRGRANEMGYTLNEYELATLPEDSVERRMASGEKEANARAGQKPKSKDKSSGIPTGSGQVKASATTQAKSRLEAPQNSGQAGATKNGKRVAGRTEAEIYAKLQLDYIEPELRENAGEIEAAEKHTLPKLIELRDVKGDLQMHTQASDGKNTIEQMAEAARELGHEYIAITDHSKAVTVANGLDDKRISEHIKNLRAADRKGLGIRVLVGAEVDILKDGRLDYSNEILEQIDVVVCSIHSYFNLDRAAMTERMLKAIENPYAQIIGHPTGRLLLKRDELPYDMEKILDACAKHGVVMECNSYPDRLDLKDVYLRMCKERGVKVVISTDSHSTSNLKYIRYGVTMARRGWLEKKDVINTLPVQEFLTALRAKPGTRKANASIR